VGFTLSAGFLYMFSFHTPISVLLYHPDAKIVGNDHILTLGHLGLIRAHQNFLVFDLDHTNEEQVCVELHLASIT
jgi:hypothetical protein